MALRDRLLSAGTRCSIINLTRHRQPDHDDLYFPHSALDVLKRLSALRPDIVHVHFGGNLFTRQAALFLVLAARPHAANVFTFHSGGYPSSPEGQGARAFSFRGFALRRLDALIGVNPQLVDVFARYGVREDKRHFIEPFASGLDAATVTNEPLPPAIEDFAARHSPLLLAVGLLEPEYGLDVQLQAFTDIRMSYPEAGLLLIGSGSLYGTLRAQIDQHPLGAHIMLAGDVPRPKTLATIARADLLLRTTHFDGDALSVREALVLGTRVLATDNGMRPAGVQLLGTLDASALLKAIPGALKSTRPMPVASKGNADPIDAVLRLYERLGGGM